MLDRSYLKKTSFNNPRDSVIDLSEATIEKLKRWAPLKTTQVESMYQVIDLFSGCGGMSLGFDAFSQMIEGSYRIIGGCDIDSDAAKSFKSNFGVPSINRDIRDLARNDGELFDFLDSLGGYDSKKPLVLIGCAPCQGFSAHRKKNWDKKDERNNLLFEFAHIAVRLRPVAIVMENVPELLSRRYWNYFTGTKEILERAGYIVKQHIYNAAAFGVPQARYRAIVIAMKRDFLLPRPVYGPSEYVTVREAIGDLPAVYPGKAHPEDTLHRCANHRQSTLEVIQSIPEDGGNRPTGIGPACLDRVKGFSDVYGRLSWDEPAITITRYARNPASGRFVHPTQNRGLTAREAAILQSFPNSFEFFGSFDSVFKQIGEAVPPRMAAAIAATLFIELSSEAPTSLEKEGSFSSITRPIRNSYSSVAAVHEKQGR